MESGGWSNCQRLEQSCSFYLVTWLPWPPCPPGPPPSSWRRPPPPGPPPPGGTWAAGCWPPRTSSLAAAGVAHCASPLDALLTFLYVITGSLQHDVTLAGTSWGHHPPPPTVPPPLTTGTGRPPAINHSRPGGHRRSGPHAPWIGASSSGLSLVHQDPGCDDHPNIQEDDLRPWLPGRCGDWTFLSLLASKIFTLILNLNISWLSGSFESYNLYVFLVLYFHKKVNDEIFSIFPQ